MGSDVTKYINKHPKFIEACKDIETILDKGDEITIQLFGDNEDDGYFKIWQQSNPELWRYAFKYKDTFECRPLWTEDIYDFIEQME